MKQLRFSLFATSSSAHRAASMLGPVVSLVLAVPAFAVDTTGVTNTYNGSVAASGLSTSANWSAGSPFSGTGAGAYADLLFTAAESGSTFTASGGASTFMNAESFNVTNGNSYTLQINSTTAARFNVGATSNTGAALVVLPFINSVSGVEQDLIYLSGGSDLTFNATNANGGTAATLPILQAGNFNVGADSVLTINSAITGTPAITINGSGTTILNGTNTYSGATTVNSGTLEIAGTHAGNGAITLSNGLLKISGTRSGTGSTTVRNGTFEISGTNAGTGYTVSDTVDGGEPLLKLSNLNALPVAAKITGSTSSLRDGSVDLAVAGAYTMSSFETGNITFTTSSGSPTTLTFTDPSKITTGSNGGRIVLNNSANLNLVFGNAADDTLDIGSDTAGTVTFNSVGNTKISGGVISTGSAVRNLVKGSAGMLTLEEASTYAGSTTINSGILRLGNALAIPGGIGATGGTSNLIFNSNSGILGLTAASGDFLRTVGTGPEQVTANPTADAALTRSMGFAAYGGDRVVDFGASIQLSAASLAGRNLVLGAGNSDSKVTLINDINLAGSSRTILVNDGSAAVDAELSGVLDSATATLVKTGAGTLALTGTNSYGSTSGGTQVLAGTLLVDGDSLSNTSKLVIDGGKVASTGTETVDTLFFGEVQQIAGTWGSSASTALLAFQDDTRFSGTGVVVVTTSPVTGDDYTTWATSFGLENPWVTLGNPTLNGEPTADPDGDGVTNNEEYAFGLNPTSGASSNPITTQLDKTTGKFSYTRRATPATTELAYTVTTSVDLSAWPIDAAATAGQAVTGTVDGVETVEVTLTGAPLTAPKLFVRMEAE
ncbi:MAG: autotransporter-associated beta strand repeat-containing protein [Akkermansiaceae bacterium]